MSHFNVSAIAWAKSQDSVHKPQVLKRGERRAEADRIEVLLVNCQAPYRWATPAHRPVSSARGLYIGSKTGVIVFPGYSFEHMSIYSTFREGLVCSLK